MVTGRGVGVLRLGLARGLVRRGNDRVGAKVPRGTGNGSRHRCLAEAGGDDQSREKETKEMPHTWLDVR